MRYDKFVGELTIPVIDIREHLNHDVKLSLLHSAIGCVGESAEFLDQMKKCCMYGNGIDYINVKEELGDILFYIVMACNELGYSLEELMDANQRKLEIRYPDKFSKEKALNRNIEAERGVI